MKKDKPPPLDILPLQPGQADECARMMANSEPWITLRRDYEASLKIISDPMRDMYVARVDGHIAGFIVLVMHGALVGYIQSILVAPDWRGQGIGSRLLAFAEERIFRETPNVFITVSSFNPDARRLYERAGFEAVGELKDYVVPGHSEILMRKTIGPLAMFGKKDKE